MATLRDLRMRIAGVKNTAKITQAMRMVAAAKMRRAQDSIESARPYVLKMQDIMQNLVDSAGDEYTNPLIDKRKEVKNVALIAVAADRGLCGSFNSNLFKFVENYLAEDAVKEIPDAKFSIIPVGTRSVKYFARTGHDVIREYKDIFGEPEFTASQDIIRFCTNGFISGKFDKVMVFFNMFKNILIQVPTKLDILPIDSGQNQEEEATNMNVDYIYEPEQKAILDDLLPKYIDIQFWRSLLESNAAEQAARMMAMENATENAKELIRDLEMRFNKKRQEAITTEMLEIVGGANAL